MATRGQQGYIRNSNGHRFSSIHFSGVINATAGQVLKVETSQLAKAGTIKVQNGKTASIFIEKLGDDGVFSDAFSTTSAEETAENLNPNAKTSLALDGGMPPSRASEVLALGLRFSAVSSADVVENASLNTPSSPNFSMKIDAVLPFWTLIVPAFAS